MVPKTTMRWFSVALMLAVSAGLASCGEPSGEGGFLESLRLGSGGWEAEEAGTPEGDVASIRTLFDAGKFSSVVSAAGKHVRKYPGERTHEEAFHLAGQAELGRGHYYQAYEWFEKQIIQFPSGELFERGLLGEIEAGEALMGGEKKLMWGFIWVTAKDEGVMILERVTEHAPGTRLAEEVLFKIGDWYYERSKWAEAIETYDQFVGLFPNGLKTPDAMLNAARATESMYRGTNFDEAPLIEAEQRYLLIQEQFPEQAGQARVAEAIRNVRNERAAKLYESATFYERTNRYDSALYYYKRIVNEFPDTRHAVTSRAALRQLGYFDRDDRRSYDSRDTAPDRPAPRDDVEAESSRAVVSER